MAKRMNVEREIARLDPQKDCQRIVMLTSYMEFPWDMVRALELALFRTFAVPSIAKLLHQTGEFEKNTQKRYDDTSIIVNEVMTFGYDSERGKSFIKRMNRIHGQYDISNDDFLYTLSTFIFVPIDWIDRFGWRKTYENERLALFYFWYEVGKRMQMKDIPETIEAFEAFKNQYEEKMFANTEATQQVANATRDLLLSFYLPKALWKSAEPFVCALMDDRLLAAMDYPVPSMAMRKRVEAALRARARLVRMMPKRSTPNLISLQHYETYPDGYEVGDVGPSNMVSEWKSKGSRGDASDKKEEVA